MQSSAGEEPATVTCVQGRDEALFVDVVIVPYAGLSNGRRVPPVREYSRNPPAIP